MNPVLSQAIKNEKVSDWIDTEIRRCKPDSVYLCNGSREEFEALAEKLIASKTWIRLNEKLRPHSFLARSDPRDVARIEERTFICSKRKEDAGPTNHWREPSLMKSTMQAFFEGCMQGRTLYIIPYCMGPLSSPLSKVGIELTDSPYVVCNMHLMTRLGRCVLPRLEEEVVLGLHSVGVPLLPGEQDVPWPCNPEKTHVVHFPEERLIYSFGSGYGGNALLGKKCFALRIASVQGRDEGWLAEHMLIMGVTSPAGEKKYFAAAFPSSCGKTNLAMLSSTIPGWKVETVGDDIAWMRFGKDGRLYAINPESGFFGVAPGTSYASNPKAMDSIRRDTIFTNVALTDEGDVWWEKMTAPPPQHLVSWLGEEWQEGSSKKAAHPNSRFTTRASQCPSIDPDFETPEGVPISGIIFGGRRSSVVPLVMESFSWQHGTFLGATVSSETTAAAAGEVGRLRHDPFAMLPFCGYHMGDYFGHWLRMGQMSSPQKLPHIFFVNWFRKGPDGSFLWPGFGDNIRVIKWCFERIDGTRRAQKTAIGYLPEEGDLDISDLSLAPDALHELTHIDKESWKIEVRQLEQYFTLFGDKLPVGIREELHKLKERLT